MPLSREAVIWAYRLILDRDPENDAVVQEKLDNTDTHKQLREALLGSEEYLGKPQIDGNHIVSDHTRIDTEVGPEILAKMFQRIAQEWEKLGEEEPYWSVLTSDRFLTENIEDNQENFSSSGQHDADKMALFFNRVGKTLPKGSCLELGCGVGRITEFLAPQFQKVIGLDISKGNLAICDERLENAGIKNVETRLIHSPEDYAAVDSYDFLFSTIVFQHNPPPIQYYMLDQLLGRLNQQGFCLFQIPIYRPNYSFDADSYLSSDLVDMEMHALPMATVFALLAKHGCQLLEVVQDDSTGEKGSYLFFAEKVG